jgi:hypothetical protein
MKGAIKMAVFFILVLVAYSWYLRAANSPYGMGPEHPLGKFGRLDKQLTEQLMLERSEVRSISHAGVRRTARMYQYQKSNTRKEHIVLLVDRDGNLRGFVGWYMNRQIGPARTPLGGFVRTHWALAGGARNPEFTRAGRGSVSQAEFSRGRVAGTWRLASGRDSGELIYLRVQ